MDDKKKTNNENKKNEKLEFQWKKAENAGYEDIEITSEMNFEIFGVVTHSITKHR